MHCLVEPLWEILYFGFVVSLDYGDLCSFIMMRPNMESFKETAQQVCRGISKHTFIKLIQQMF